MRFKRIQPALSRTRAFLQTVGCSRPRLEVSAADAAALRRTTLALLDGYSDLAMVISRELWVEARQRRWRLECLARLLDDLGWSDENASATAITVPPSQLVVALDAISNFCAEMLEADRRQYLAEAQADAREYERGLTASDALRRRLRISVAAPQEG